MLHPVFVESLHMQHVWAPVGNHYFITMLVSLLSMDKILVSMTTIHCLTRTEWEGTPLWEYSEK